MLHLRGNTSHSPLAVASVALQKNEVFNESLFYTKKLNLLFSMLTSGSQPVVHEAVSGGTQQTLAFHVEMNSNTYEIVTNFFHIENSIVT